MAANWTRKSRYHQLHCPRFLGSLCIAILRLRGRLPAHRRPSLRRDLTARMKVVRSHVPNDLEREPHADRRIDVVLTVNVAVGKTVCYAAVHDTRIGIKSLAQLVYRVERKVTQLTTAGAAGDGGATGVCTSRKAA